MENSKKGHSESDFLDLDTKDSANNLEHIQADKILENNNNVIIHDNIKRQYSKSLSKLLSLLCIIKQTIQVTIKRKSNKAKAKKKLKTEMRLLKKKLKIYNVNAPTTINKRPKKDLSDEKSWFINQYEKHIGRGRATDADRNFVLGYLRMKTMFRFVPEEIKLRYMPGSKPKPGESVFFSWTGPRISVCACPHRECFCRGDMVLGPIKTPFAFRLGGNPFRYIRMLPCFRIISAKSQATKFYDKLSTRLKEETEYYTLLDKRGILSLMGPEICISRCRHFLKPGNFRTTKFLPLFSKKLEVVEPEAEEEKIEEPVEEQPEEDDRICNVFSCEVSSQTETGPAGELNFGKVKQFIYPTVKDSILPDLEGKKLTISPYELEAIAFPDMRVCGRNLNRMINVEVIKNRISRLLTSILEIKDPGVPVSNRSTQLPCRGKVCNVSENPKRRSTRSYICGDRDFESIPEIPWTVRIKRSALEELHNTNNVEDDENECPCCKAYLETVKDNFNSNVSKRTNATRKELFETLADTDQQNKFSVNSQSNYNSDEEFKEKDTESVQILPNLETTKDKENSLTVKEEKHKVCQNELLKNTKVINDKQNDDITEEEFLNSKMTNNDIKANENGNKKNEKFAENLTNVPLIRTQPENQPEDYNILQSKSDDSKIGTKSEEITQEHSTDNQEKKNSNKVQNEIKLDKAQVTSNIESQEYKNISQDHLLPSTSKKQQKCDFLKGKNFVTQITSSVYRNLDTKTSKQRDESYAQNLSLELNKKMHQNMIDGLTNDNLEINSENDYVQSKIQNSMPPSPRSINSLGKLIPKYPNLKDEIITDTEQSKSDFIKSEPHTISSTRGSTKSQKLKTTEESSLTAQSKSNQKFKKQINGFDNTNKQSSAFSSLFNWLFDKKSKLIINRSISSKMKLHSKKNSIDSNENSPKEKEANIKDSVTSEKEVFSMQYTSILSVSNDSAKIKKDDNRGGQ